MLPTPKKIQYQGGSVPSDTPIEQKYDSLLGREEYRIRIARDKIMLEGGSETALFYARTSLEQLKLLHKDGLPMLELEDGPAFAYRAFHIDCARHFVEMDELKKMIRMSAEFKLNYFHWHFSDDQGWRIECSRYPRLHEIGSVREGDHFGKYDSYEREGGYYTRREVKELVAYCADLGIEVVPEIDMPGHVLSILAAYPQLSCSGEPAQVGTRAGIFHGVLCPGKEETFTFVENLLEDMLELFPGKYFHIGGDEAPKRNWKQCPHCKKRMEEERLASVQELQGYMQNRICAWLKSRGRIPVVWNESVYGGNLDQDAVVQLWTEDRGGRLKEHLMRGGKAIFSMVGSSYCDHPYGRVPLKNVYGMETSPEELKECEADAVLGTECLIWTEYVRTPGQMEKLCWPRFAASAQVGWCGSRRPDYEAFCRDLRELLPVFEKYGVEFTEPDGWDPDPQTAREQMEAFDRNIRPEDIEETKKAQAEV